MDIRVILLKHAAVTAGEKIACSWSLHDHIGCYAILIISTLLLYFNKQVEFFWKFISKGAFTCPVRLIFERL